MLVANYKPFAVFIIIKHENIPTLGLGPSRDLMQHWRLLKSYEFSILLCLFDESESSTTWNGQWSTYFIFV